MKDFYRAQSSGIVMVLPLMVVVVVFKLIPLAQCFVLSLTNTQAGTAYVSFEHFIRMAYDPALRAAAVNAVAILASLPIWIAVPVLLAFAIHERVLGWRVFKIVFIFPYAVPPVIAGYIFTYIFGLEGPLNALLINWVGVAPQDWIGSTSTSLLVLAIVGFWGFFGLGTIIILAGLQGLPAHCLEAAGLDGASWHQRLLQVALPQILSTVGYWALICSAGLLIWFFPYIYAITGGGPGYSSLLPEYYIYQVATRSADPHYSSAIGMTLMAYVFVVSAPQIIAMVRDISYARK